MCGIAGVIAQNRVSQDIFDALTIIQHRGQDAAGMLTSNGRRVSLRKGNGLVRDVIRQEHVIHLRGRMGIGHVRYPTAGTDNPHESQPFYVNSPYGLGLVHNGNLTNSDEITEVLIREDLRHLNTSSDSEVLLNVVAHELQRLGKPELTTDILFSALKNVYKRLQGAYSVIMVIHDYGLVAFRDPHGIRPLIYGKRETKEGVEYMVASESIALNALGFEVVADVQPGEVIFFDKQGQVHKMLCAEKTAHTPCIFEYIYLARPDSVIDNISVYKARVGMGKALANKIKKVKPNHDIDVVVPVPDTSRSSALALAHKLGVYYSEGLVKNRYIGRTFIMPGQEERRSSVRLKLNAIREEVAGKNVLLVDDSIVRGTTSKEIIQMVRDAGANKVYFASAAPQVCNPNVYGIDIPTSNELVAYGRSLEEIAKLIETDWLIYQDLEDVYAAINAAALSPDSQIKRFEDSIFTGDYVAGNIDKAFLTKWSETRGKKKDKSTSGLHEQRLLQDFIQG